MSFVSQGKARLRLGICAVGTMVLLATTVLSFDLSKQFFLTEKSDPLTELLSLTWLFAGIVLVQLPFDIMGGLLIPRKYEMQQLSARRLILNWARSVLLQVILYTCLFFLYLQIGRILGPIAVIIIFFSVQLALVALQYPIWRTLVGQSQSAVYENNLIFVNNVDHRFTGGVLGLPGREKVVIPEKWRTRMSPEILEILIQRRFQAIHNGGRIRGVLAAILWNTLSLSIALLLTPTAFESVAGIANTFFWSILLSFIGLLILPWLNRLSVFQLDQVIKGRFGLTKAELLASEFDDLTEQDPSRHIGEESVFQPIPCPRRRIENLKKDRGNYVPAWNVARMTIFLSWAFGGPLSRSVHCNVGRPELWAILPMD